MCIRDRLGTANNLDYKVRFAAYIILDTGGDGLAGSDRGTLDVSDQQTDGTIPVSYTHLDVYKRQV